MTPIDDELRKLFHARADAVTPAPDPLSGIERRATRLRRRRVAASVAGAAVAVAAVAVGVSTVLPHRNGDDGSSQFATPSASASPSSALSANALDPQHPWAYRGDPAVIAGNELVTLRAEWAAKHPGATLTPLFGQVYEPSGRPEVVFVSTAPGGDRWGVATSSESGWEFEHDAALTRGATALMAALPGDEVPRLLVVAGPATGDMSYAADGASFHTIVGPVPGVAFHPLEGDTSRDAVRVLDGDGNLDKPVFLGPAPDAPAGTAPPATAPPNVLQWIPRGATPSPALLEQATAAFATSLGAKRSDVQARVLYAGSVNGREHVFLEAWVNGSDAHTFGFASDGKGGGEPFLGPVIGAEPAALAYLVSAAPGETTDTLIVIPRPGTGAVSYAASASAPYTDIASGRSDLNPIGVVHRDPKASSDRLRVLQADGSVLFQGAVQPLLCGAKGCG